jgi:hypothetical protein
MNLKKIERMSKKRERKGFRLGTRTWKEMREGRKKQFIPDPRVDFQSNLREFVRENLNMPIEMTDFLFELVSQDGINVICIVGINSFIAMSSDEIARKELKHHQSKLGLSKHVEELKAYLSFHLKVITLEIDRKIEEEIENGPSF